LRGSITLADSLGGAGAICQPIAFPNPVTNGIGIAESRGIRIG